MTQTGNEQGPGQPQGTAPKGTGLAPNIASLLCYICPPLIAVAFLVIEKENQDVKFHAWQGAIFGCFMFVLMVCLMIISALFGKIFSPLAWIIDGITLLMALAGAIVWVICVVKAYQGERWRIPYLGDYAASKAGV